MIAEEVDDEDEGNQQQKTSSSSRTGSPVDRAGRPDVHNVHRCRRSTGPVDRSEGEKTLSEFRSTGTVDRPGEISLSKYRSTGPVDRSTGLGKKLLLRKLRSSEYKSCWVIF